MSRLKGNIGIAIIAILLLCLIAGAGQLAASAQTNAMAVDIARYGALVESWWSPERRQEATSNRITRQPGLGGEQGVISEISSRVWRLRGFAAWFRGDCTASAQAWERVEKGSDPVVVLDAVARLCANRPVAKGTLGELELTYLWHLVEQARRAGDRTAEQFWCEAILNLSDTNHPLYWRAWAAVRAAEEEMSPEVYMQALAHSPADFWLYERAVEAATQANRYELALNLAIQASDQSKLPHPLTWALQTTWLAILANRLDLAWEWANRAADIGGIDNWHVKRIMAEVLCARGEYQAALGFYDEALRKTDNPLDILFRKSVCLFSSGQEEVALELLRSALMNASPSQTKESSSLFSVLYRWCKQQGRETPECYLREKFEDVMQVDFDTWMHMHR